MTPYRPMLATPWPAPFTDEAWSFELKWDGIRAILVSSSDHAVLRSRNGNVISGRYPEVAVEGLDAVLDGEIVAFDESGLPSFDRLQGRMHRSNPSDTADPVHMIVFDLLQLGGRDLRSLSYDRRRAQLAELELPKGLVLGDVVPGEGEALFSAVRERGLEGMVAKRRESTYQSGVRSPDWRKVLNMRTATVLVGGYLPSETGRPFQSLVVGLWEGDRLRFAGSVGSGFDEGSLVAIRAALDEMAVSRQVFWPDAALEEAVQVEPVLVAHVRYRTWTRGGRLRHPVFKGFGDEPPAQLTWSAEGPPSTEGTNE